MSGRCLICRELYEQMRFERDLNQRLYEALLKDVNDYQAVICNYCLKDQTDKCISPDEAVLGCGQFEWRGFNHDNERKKREKYGEIKVVKSEHRINCKNCINYDEDSPNYGYTEECKECGWYPWADNDMTIKFEDCKNEQIY